MRYILFSLSLQTLKFYFTEYFLNPLSTELFFLTYICLICSYNQWIKLIFGSHTKCVKNLEFALVKSKQQPII